MDNYTKKMFSIVRKLWNLMNKDNEPEEGWGNIEVDASDLMDLLIWADYLYRRANPDKDTQRAYKIINEAAKAIENPGPGNVVFTLRLEGDKTTLKTKAGEGVNPQESLKKAILAFEQELKDAENCPIHNR